MTLAEQRNEISWIERPELMGLVGDVAVQPHVRAIRPYAGAATRALAAAGGL